MRLVPPPLVRLRSPSAYAALTALALGWACLLGTSATRLLRDAPTAHAPTAETFELDADNYYAAPRMRAQGVPLERNHAAYVVHVPLLALVALPLNLLAPSRSHEATRAGALLLQALLAALVLVGAWRSRPSGLLWPLALVLGWALSPGIWGLARLAYAEYFVGLALVGALVSTPEAGASWRRAALGGLGAGVLVASKWYGILPVACLAGTILVGDLRARRGPAAAAAYAAAALLGAVALWGLAGWVYGVDPVLAVRELLGGARTHATTAGRGPLGVLLAAPSVLTPRWPGSAATWLLVLLALRLRGAHRRLAPRRFLVWASSFAVPWLLSSVPYRLWPLLVALPWLVRPRAPGASPTRGEDLADLLLEVAIVGNLLWILDPPFLAGRARSAALLATCLVLALRVAARGLPRADLVAPLRAVAFGGLLAAGTLGALWQALDWRDASYEWDESAQAVAREAPHARRVAGMLPELWCRYLPGSASLDVATALAPLPLQAARTSEIVVLIARPEGGFADEALLDDRRTRVAPFPYWRGERRDLAIGIRLR